MKVIKYNKKRYTFPPEGGWLERSWYLVEVAFSTTNVIHRSLFFTGFVDENRIPGAYNEFANHSYDDGKKVYADCCYIKAVKPLLSEDELLCEDCLTVMDLKEEGILE
jgi:hypothetical protein